MFNSSRTTWRADTGFFCFWAVSLCIAVIFFPGSSLALETGLRDPGPYEVQVFGEPAFSGAPRNLVLEPGSLHAYFERLDDDRISAVRSLRAGSAVGVVLFRHPFFVSRDQSCAATLGSDETPDLIWTGATADFLPGNTGRSAVGDVSDTGAAGYASAILFRRADGPPPGALLMKRRRSYGKGCGNILRSLNFERRFVPMDFRTSLSNNGERAPLQRGCVNLQGVKIANKTGAGSVRLSDMRKSDRIALLQPSDLDPVYRKRDRRFHTVLFDADNCQGESVRIDAVLAAASGANSTGGDSIRRDLLLSNFLFRDRVRSLRVTASDDKVQTATKAVSSAPAADVKPKVSTKSTPIQKIETGKNPARTGTPKSESNLPAPAFKTKPAPAESLVGEMTLDKPKAAPLKTKTVQPALGKTDVKTGLPTAKLEPMTALPSKPKAAVTTAAQPLQAIQAAESASPQTSKISTPSVGFADEKTPLAERNSALTQKVNKKEDSRVQTAQAELETKSSAPAGSDSAASGEQVFTFPVYDVYRLNYCLNSKGGCGEAAASKWCELKGFKRAVAWQKDNNIGGIFPTFLIGDRRICAQYKCDGFAEVTCGN